MNVGTNGIVVDQHGHVLLIKRNDTRTFAPPGGALDVGELPPDGTAREVREETGLIVLPVRLVTLTYLPLKPNGYLMFSFRCLLRGGEIATSEESPVVGFFKSNPLPQRITSFHRERLEKGLTHVEERPLTFSHPITPFTKLSYYLLQQVVYPWMDVKRRLKGEAIYQPPPNWDVTTYLLCQNEAGATLWYRAQENDSWQLPGGEIFGLNVPWETAVQLAKQQTGHTLQLGRLSNVYSHPNKNQLILVFTAECSGSMPESSATIGWFAPGREPVACRPEQCQIVANVADNGGQVNQATQFRFFK
jgi:ADP-ribose pyrophosphatase YjhB (NUDIX family)